MIIEALLNKPKTKPPMVILKKNKETNISKPEKNQKNAPNFNFFSIFFLFHFRF